MFKRVMAVAAVSIALAGFAGTAAAQTWSAEQQEVWQLEQQQWKMAAAKDLSWIDTDGAPEHALLGDRRPDAA